MEKITRAGNLGGAERILRIVAGIGLMVVGIMTRTVLADTLIVLGAVLLATGGSGFCLVYRVLGVSTRHPRPSGTRHSGG